MSDEHDDGETVSITPGPRRGVFSFSVLIAGISTGLLATYCMVFFDPPYTWAGAAAVSLIGGITAAVLAGVPQRQGEAKLLRERDAREEERKAWGAWSWISSRCAVRSTSRHWPSRTERIR